MLKKDDAEKDLRSEYLGTERWFNAPQNYLEDEVETSDTESAKLRRLLDPINPYARAVSMKPIGIRSAFARCA